MSLNDLELEKGIIVFPNPGINYITVKNITQPTEFRLIDNVGKTLKNGFVNSSGEIKISDLSSGVYFLELKTKDKSTMRKIIKK